MVNEEIIKQYLIEKWNSPFNLFIEKICDIDSTVHAQTIPSELVELGNNREDHVIFYMIPIMRQAIGIKDAYKIIDKAILHEYRHIEQIIFMRKNDLDLIKILLKDRDLLEKDAIDYSNGFVNDLDKILIQSRHTCSI